MFCFTGSFSRYLATFLLIASPAGAEESACAIGDPTCSACDGGLSLLQKKATKVVSHEQTNSEKSLDQSLEKKPTGNKVINKVNKTTVIFMRHCFRSMGNGGCNAVPGLTLFDDYSSQPWPPYPAVQGDCLPRGLPVLTAQGESIKANGGLPMPLRVVADDVPPGQRDVLTLAALLKGLDPKPEDVSHWVSHVPFARGDSAECAKEVAKDGLFDGPDMKQAMLDCVATKPLPPGYHDAMDKLVEVLGTGKAGNWTGIPCTPVPSGEHWGGGPPFMVLGGACSVASNFVERLVTEWGAGQEVGWDKITPMGAASLMMIHTYWMQVTYGCPAVQRWMYSALARFISARLEEGAQGTTLIAGHTNEQTALQSLLGLTWDATPFGIDGTMAGTMLRFDRDGDKVTASFQYMADYTIISPANFKSVPATFAGGKSHISVAQFQEAVGKATIAACAPTKHDQSQDWDKAYASAMQGEALG